MSDMEVYNRYKEYESNGASNDPSGIIGQGIMNDVLKRAGGVEHLNGWLYKMGLRKRLEEKTIK